MSLQFPSSPSTGQTFPAPLQPGQPSWVWDGAKWTSRGLANAMVDTSPLPPLNPRVGDLWFDPVEGNTYVYFDDGNSQQWVVTINQPGDFPRMGVADGSNAVPGEIGEYIDSGVVNVTELVSVVGDFTNTISIDLSAGDWDVAAWINATLVTPGSLILETGDIHLNDPPGLLAQPYYRGSIGDIRTITLTNGPRRFSLATATTIWVWIYTSAWQIAYAQISARRVR